jgi:hypothetical protein
MYSCCWLLIHFPRHLLWYLPSQVASETSPWSHSDLWSTLLIGRLHATWQHALWSLIFIELYSHASENEEHWLLVWITLRLSDIWVGSGNVWYYLPSCVHKIWVLQWCNMKTFSEVTRFRYSFTVVVSVLCRPSPYLKLHPACGLVIKIVDVQCRLTSV